MKDIPKKSWILIEIDMTPDSVPDSGLEEMVWEIFTLGQLGRQDGVKKTDRGRVWASKHLPSTRLVLSGHPQSGLLRLLLLPEDGESRRLSREGASETKNLDELFRWLQRRHSANFQC